MWRALKGLVKFWLKVGCVVTAVATVLHHYAICGKWFEVYQVLHHETIVLCSLFLLLGLLLADWLR